MPRIIVQNTIMRSAFFPLRGVQSRPRQHHHLVLWQCSAKTFTPSTIAIAHCRPPPPQFASRIMLKEKSGVYIRSDANDLVAEMHTSRGHDHKNCIKIATRSWLNSRQDGFWNNLSPHGFLCSICFPGCRKWAPTARCIWIFTCVCRSRKVCVCTSRTQSVSWPSLTWPQFFQTPAAPPAFVLINFLIFQSPQWRKLRLGVVSLRRWKCCGHFSFCSWLICFETLNVGFP